MNLAAGQIAAASSVVGLCRALYAFLQGEDTARDEDTQIFTVQFSRQ
jgi:hypothetical protein